MSRAESELEYLSRMVPASARISMGRRDLFKVGLASLAVPTLLAACGGSSSGGGSKDSGTVTFGSNQSDAVPKAAYAAMLADAGKAIGDTVKINTVDHNTFQENINNYLQGNPDDVFTWFAGYRMDFFATKGLAGDISDLWGNLSGFTDTLKKASTASDGKQYFIPLDYYPWAVFYRKSVFSKYGYQVPKTLDEFNTLGAQMKKDGLIPLAFGDKDGWPAMGTFDILNMRINGFDFHKQLMAGQGDWTSAQVSKVFETWRGLLPLHQDGSLGRTWQEAAQTLQKKQAGMYVLGMFVGQQFPKAEQDDLDFFPFPEIDSTIGTDALDAPIDGFMMAKKPKNEAGAKKLLGALAKPAAGETYVKADPTVIAANKDADTSGYSSLQKKAIELIGSAKNVAQFMDRDTRPDFASTVMIPSIQAFIKNPGDAASIQKSIESQKKSIFTS